MARSQRTDPNQGILFDRYKTLVDESSEHPAPGESISPSAALPPLDGKPTTHTPRYLAFDDEADSRVVALPEPPAEVAGEDAQKPSSMSAPFPNEEGPPPARTQKTLQLDAHDEDPPVTVATESEQPVAPPEDREPDADVSTFTFMDPPKLPVLSISEQRQMLQDLIAEFNIKGLDIDEFQLRPVQYTAAIELLRHDSTEFAFVIEAGVAAGKTGMVLLKALAEKAKGNRSLIIIPRLALEDQSREMFERFASKGWLTIDTFSNNSSTKGSRAAAYSRSPDVTIITKDIFMKEYRKLNWTGINFITLDEPQLTRTPSGRLPVAERLYKFKPSRNAIRNYMSATLAPDKHGYQMAFNSIGPCRFKKVKDSESLVEHEVVPVEEHDLMVGVTTAIRDQAIRCKNLAAPREKQKTLFPIEKKPKHWMPDFGIPKAPKRLEVVIEEDDLDLVEQDNSQIPDKPTRETDSPVTPDQTEPNASPHVDEFPAETPEGTSKGMLNAPEVSAKSALEIERERDAARAGGFIKEGRVWKRYHERLQRQGWHSFSEELAYRYMQAFGKEKFTAQELGGDRAKSKMQSAPDANPRTGAKKELGPGEISAAEKRVLRNREFRKELLDSPFGESPYAAIFEYNDFEELMDATRHLWQSLPMSQCAKDRRAQLGLQPKRGAPPPEGRSHTYIGRDYFDCGLSYSACRELSDSAKMIRGCELIDENWDHVTSGTSIIFTTTVRLAELYGEALEILFGQYGLKPIVIHGKSSKKHQVEGREKLVKGERKMLVTTIDWAGVGVDLPHPHFGFLCDTRSKSQKLKQVLGRYGRDGADARVFMLAAKNTPEPDWYRLGLESAEQANRDAMHLAEMLYPSFAV